MVNEDAMSRSLQKQFGSHSHDKHKAILFFWAHDVAIREDPRMSKHKAILASSMKQLNASLAEAGGHTSLASSSAPSRFGISCILQTESDPFSKSVVSKGKSNRRNAQTNILICSPKRHMCEGSSKFEKILRTHGLLHVGHHDHATSVWAKDSV